MNRESAPATASPAAPARGIPRGERLPLALLAAGGLLLAGLRFNDSLSLNGDNALYLLLARNLVTGGPYDNAGFPWGYPALLMPGVALFGPDHLLEALPWLKLLSVLAFVLALGLLYALFRARHARPVAFAAVALFAVNDVALLYTNDVMTEMPYLAASALALLWWQRRVDPPPARVADAGLWDALPARPPGRGTWVGAALLLALPYYLRTIGLAMLAAPPVVLLWRRRWRAAVLLGLALAALAAPWAAFSTASNPDRNYTAAFWLRDPYHPELGTISGPGELLQRFDARVQLYSTVVLPTMIFPRPDDPSGPLRTVGGWLVLIGVVAGFAIRLVRRVELPEVYVAAYLVILCSWWWNGDRFLMPVLPFLLHYLAEALVSLGRLLGRALRRPRPRLAVWGTAALLVLLLIPNLFQDQVAIAQNLRYWAGQDSPPNLTAEDQLYVRASVWVGAHSPPGSVVLARKPSITAVFANRPSELIPQIPPDQYPAWLTAHHVTYILEDSFLWSTHTINYLRPALQADASHFRLLQRFPPPAPPDPPTQIWLYTP